MRKVAYKGEQWLVIEHLPQYRCMTIKHADRDEFLLGIKESEVEMTTELTHEQANILKILVDQPYANNMLTVDQFDLVKDLLDYAGQHHYMVSQSGLEALAAYNAKWVTVIRNDFEVAIEAFETFVVLCEERYDGIGSPSIEEEKAALKRLQAALEAK